MKTTIYSAIIRQAMNPLLLSLCLSLLFTGAVLSQVTPGSINPATQSVESWDKVTLTHTGASGVTSRQWQLSTDGGNTWTNISGATGTTCSTGTLSNPGAVDLIRRYRVRVNGQNLYSAESVITVIADITPGSISPAELTIDPGGSLTLAHTGSDGINWRQWQVSTNGGSTWSSISNANSETYNTGAIANTGSTSITRKYRVQINSQSIYSAESVITINGTGGGSVTPGSITPATQTIASGGSVSLTHSGSSGVTSRQWQLSTNGGSSWSDISGATSTTCNTGALTNSSSSDITCRYRVKINGQSTYSSESVITVTGNSVIPGSITPASQTVASGGSVALTHSGGTGITSRQWQLSTNGGSSWSDISGATSTTCNTGALTNSSSSDITCRYRVKINGQSTYSSESVITVTGSGGSGVNPGIISPAAQSVETWDNVTLTHSGSSGVTSRQWQLSMDNGNTWSIISGATATTCNTGTLSNTGAVDIIRRYRVKLNGQELYSAESAITVIASVKPGSISPANQTIESGGSLTLTHTGSDGINWRQWQVSNDNGSTWSNIPSANSETYNTGALTNSGSSSITCKYRIQINSQDIYSAQSVITINSSSGVNAGSVTPATQTVASGGSVVLTHSGGTGITTRQWQYSNDNGSTWADISGATAATYNTGALTNTGSSNITIKYRVKVNGQAVYSVESVITVSVPVTGGSITPATQTIASGGSVSLTHSGGTGITTRQWQKSADNGSTWADISGATAATYNTGALTNPGSSNITIKYRVKVNGQAVYSAESVITVSVPVAGGSITPAAQTVASVGSVVLTHSGGTGITSRQWQLSTDNGTTWADISGATATTYNTGALTNNGSSNITIKYRVKVNGQAVYSVESVITVSVPVTGGSITPATQTVASGGLVSLTHSGSTGVTARQWQLSTDNGSTWTDISGATATTYNTGALTNNGSSDITLRYRVKINGQAIYSAESEITVSIPVIAGNITPANPKIRLGASAALFHVDYSGVIYRQWQLSTDNGSTWTDISGATYPMYYTPNMINSGSNDTSVYYRVKINGQDIYTAISIVTAPVELKVGGITPDAPQIYSGESVTLTHINSKGVNSRQWQLSTDQGNTWTDIPEATAVTYNTGALDSKSFSVFSFRIKLNNDGDAYSGYSDQSHIIVQPLGGYIYPAAYTVASGKTISLLHQRPNTTSRQWQISTDNGSTWTDIPGATEMTYYNMSGYINTGSSDITLLYRVKFNGLEVYSTESVVTVTGNGSITPGSISPAEQTVASGSSVILNHSGSLNVTSRQWQYTIGDDINFVDIQGATDATYNTGALVNKGSSDIIYRYRVKLDGMPCYSDESVITVNGGALYSGNIIFDYNPDGSVTCTHVGYSGITSRQWQMKVDGVWKDIPDATAATYNTGALSNYDLMTIILYYRVKINGQDIYSSENFIAVPGTITPAVQMIASGGSVTLTHRIYVEATRQWQQSTDNGSTWTDIPSATAATYNTGALTNTHRYRVKVNGRTYYSAESVIVVGVTAGIITPTIKTVASGGSVSLIHSGSSGVTSRQWQLSKNNGSTWTDIPGAMADTYNTGTLTNNGTTGITHKYRVKINELPVYSYVSVITVSGSGGDGSGGDDGGGEDSGGGRNYPEGTVSYTYDAAGNRVARNKVINMVTTATITKSSMVGTGTEETEAMAVTEEPKFEEILTEMKIIIYPNPAKGMLQIDITGGEISKDAKIHIFNQSGNLVRQVNGISGSNVVDISSQSAGMYLLRITLNKDSVSVWKVIKD